MGGVVPSACSCRKSIISQTIPEPNTVKARSRTGSLSEPTTDSINNQSTTIEGTKDSVFSLKQEMNHWTTIAAALCRIHCGLIAFRKTEESLYEIIANYLVIPPDTPEPIPYDPYDINEDEFGSFIIEKVNQRTFNRLCEHLRASDGIGDQDLVQADEMINVLLFACILFLKFKEKTERRAEMTLDKKRVRKALMPSCDWMLNNKLNLNPSLQRSNYRILGLWLIEYYAQNNEQMYAY